MSLVMGQIPTPAFVNKDDVSYDILLLFISRHNVVCTTTRMLGLLGSLQIAHWCHLSICIL